MSTITMPKITSGCHGHGAYGYSSKPPGTTMTLWYCGVWVVDGKLQQRGPGYMGNTSSPCMHETREAARNCGNRTAYAKTGEGTLAPPKRGTA